ncbi:hypothetical protein AVEN_22557-1 [Araneus ventricosus]|uniref:Uncharacterized protein n=1 Tax=Araneus ventricosus TaxID=182803 RepID=A0A4Y2E861_ARAVE|nr:hypothetical protein AVEN_22557-1 [Araneus ventricosus]
MVIVGCSLSENGTFGVPKLWFLSSSCLQLLSWVALFLKTGHFGVPKLCVGTTGQATKIRECPIQKRKYGHIRETYMPVNIYIVLWGYVKQHVYSERINDINHLKQRITDVIHSVTPDVLTRVWEELDYRLHVCWATNGAHIELR